MADNPDVIPFPESKGDQPPAGTHRNVLVKFVKSLGVVTSAQFKDKNGNPVSKPMLEVSLEFKVADKPLVWTRQFTLTASAKGALFPLYLAATGMPPAVGGPGAKAMEGKHVDMGIKYEPRQNGNGSWAKIEWVSAPARN
jgi:hypothetical protein